MINLKDLLKDQEQIWFLIEDKTIQKTAFLSWAKQNGCTWSSNKVIEPKTDFCSSHMGISKDFVLGYVGGHCWFNSKNPPQKIDFKEILGEE